MTKISEYPIISNPTEDDILIGTDVNSSDVTKNFSIGSIVNLVENGGRPYKSYTALLTQTGTNNPTSIVLENTTGATAFISRATAGNYSVAFSSNVLTTNKTAVFINNSDTPGSRLIYANVSGPNTVTVITNNGGQIDNVLNSTAIEIRIYN
jgi:hypothetical protein